MEGEFEGPSDVEDLPLCDLKSYEKQRIQSAIWRPRTIIVTTDRIVDDDRNHHTTGMGHCYHQAHPVSWHQPTTAMPRFSPRPVRPGQVITQSPEQGSVHDNVFELTNEQQPVKQRKARERQRLTLLDAYHQNTYATTT